MIENIIEFYNVYNDTLGPALRSEKEPVMSENTFVPLYQQIKDDIKSAIEHGKYKPKEQIPTEPELSAEYSVSRVTVRRAVEELCSEGYLVKQQGRGTFVSAPRIHRKFSVSNQVVSFTKTCREYGMLAGAKVAERKIVPVREDEKAFWGCGDDALLLYIQRIRTADGQPVFLENLFMLYHDFKSLMQADWENQSVFELMASVSGYRVAAASRRTIEAVRATSEQSSLLNVPVGEALLHLNCYFVDRENRPICIGRPYYIGSRYMFEI